MLTCVRRIPALAVARSSVSSVLSRSVSSTSSSAQATSSDSTKVSSEKSHLEPYPRTGVLAGYYKGVQVDFIQKKPENERLIEKICSLPEKGEYLFEYRNVKEYLDSDAVTPEIRKCFQLKYVGGSALTDNLLAYLWDELHKTQDPFNVDLNKQERRVAKLALSYRNLVLHRKRIPKDRPIKHVYAMVFYALRRATLDLQKMNFKRADYLVNELNIPPPIEVQLKGPTYNRSKPKDQGRTIAYYRKVFMRLEAKIARIKAREKSRDVEEMRYARMKHDAEAAATAASE